MEAEIKYPGKHVYWHTSAHCWDDKPVGAGREQEPYRPTPPSPSPAGLKIEILRVRPVTGEFIPWDLRIGGVEFLKSLMGE